MSGAMLKQNRGWRAHWLSNLTMLLQKCGLRTSNYAWKADTRPLHQTIDSIRATNPAAVPRYRSMVGFTAHWPNATALLPKNALIASGENAIILFTRERSF